MATTPRWGLEYFGAGTSGSLDAKGAKFTRGDRLVFDRVLASLETHSHAGGERLDDPAIAPTASLSVGSGTLEGGSTYHYVVTYVDQFGLETAASEEVSVATPSKITVPPSPGVNTVVGGSLDDGLYLYGITAHDSAGETPLSDTVSVTVSDWKTVEVTPVLPAGATQISIWRQGPLDSGFTRLVTQGNANVFSDDGSIPPEPCATDPDKAPPSRNTTGSTSAITVTPAAAEITDPTLVERWRVYRSTTSGVYGASSLLFESGTATTSYLDNGAGSLQTGSPPLVSQTMSPSQPLGGGGGLGGMLLLRSLDNTAWQVIAGLDGAITTIPVDFGPITMSLFVDEGIGLTDSGGNPWRVTIGNDGVLTTTQEAAPADEGSFIYGAGPDLPTHDGSLHYRLGVSVDGELITYGSVGDRPTAILGNGSRRLFIQQTPPALPEEGDIFIDNSSFTGGWNTATVQVFKA